MPRQRRRAKARRQLGLSDRQIEDLTRGYCVLQPMHEFGSDEERRECWFANRDELLAEWIERRPGSRPQSWWKYESTEGRRSLGRAVIPKVPGDRSHFGTPVCYQLAPDCYPTNRPRWEKVNSLT